ncbi:MAG: hypothetical protein ACREJG_11510 [Candidatus Rokuibacteriota bacterium]
MNEKETPKAGPGRRTFLAGLLTGAGVAAALGTGTVAAKDKTTEPPADPKTVLYRRTADVERYYRTLYRS